MIYEYEAPFGVGGGCAQDRFAFRKVSRFPRGIAPGGATGEETCGAACGEGISSWFLECAARKDARLPSVATWVAATTKEAKEVAPWLLRGFFQITKLVPGRSALLHLLSQKAAPLALGGIRMEGRFGMRHAG